MREWAARWWPAFAIATLAALPMATLTWGSATQGTLRISVEGAVVVETDLRSCHSLQPHGVAGVSVHGVRRGQGSFSLLSSPDEDPALHLELPGPCDSPRGARSCAQVAVSPSSCSVFDVAVQPTRTTIGQVTLLRGHARVACELPEARSLWVDVVFDGC